MTQTRTLFIGDVHGLSGPLAELLRVLELQAGDRVVFLGDLIDKGPDPIGVIQIVRDLANRPDIETHLIRGNHEDKHLRYRRNLTLRPRVANRQASEASVLRRFYTDAREEDWLVLEASLPYLSLPDLDMLALHAGIPGNMKTLPEAERYDVATGKEKEYLERIWRTRFISRETGSFVGLGKQKPEDPFWAEVYDGRFGHAVFGHQPFMDGAARFPHATGIDTGAVHGGMLTALVVQHASPRDFRLVQVEGELHTPLLYQ